MFSSQNRDALERKYKSNLVLNEDLDRSQVSFQANKKLPFYRWFKYKEGFSAPLIKYILSHIATKKGSLLDPFAGSGISLFVAQQLGWKTVGIELLSPAIFSVKVRGMMYRLQSKTVRDLANNIKSMDVETLGVKKYSYRHISTTEGAFSKENEKQLNG